MCVDMQVRILCFAQAMSVPSLKQSVRSMELCSRAEEHRVCENSPEFYGLNRERGEVSPGSEVRRGKGRPLENHFF